MRAGGNADFDSYVHLKTFFMFSRLLISNFQRLIIGVLLILSFKWLFEIVHCYRETKQKEYSPTLYYFLIPGKLTGFNLLSKTQCILQPEK